MAKFIDTGVAGAPRPWTRGGRTAHVQRFGGPEFTSRESAGWEVDYAEFQPMFIHPGYPGVTNRVLRPGGQTARARRTFLGRSTHHDVPVPFRTPVPGSLVATDIPCEGTSYSRSLAPGELNKWVPQQFRVSRANRGRLDEVKQQVGPTLDIAYANQAQSPTAYVRSVGCRGGKVAYWDTMADAGTSFIIPDSATACEKLAYWEAIQATYQRFAAGSPYGQSGNTLKFEDGASGPHPARAEAGARAAGANASAVRGECEEQRRAASAQRAGATLLASTASLRFGTGRALLQSAADRLSKVTLTPRETTGAVKLAQTLNAGSSSSRGLAFGAQGLRNDADQARADARFSDAEAARRREAAEALDATARAAEEEAALTAEMAGKSGTKMLLPLLGVGAVLLVLVAQRKR